MSQCLSKRDDALAGYRILSYISLSLIPSRHQSSIFLAARVTVDKPGASLTVLFPFQVTYFCLGFGRILSLSWKFINFIRIYVGLGVILCCMFLFLGKPSQTADSGTVSYISLSMLLFYFSLLRKLQLYDWLSSFPLFRFNIFPKVFLHSFLLYTL